MLVGAELVFLSLVLAASANLHCTSPVTLTILSQRNNTGHWTAKVDLEHLRKSGPWVVETHLCEEGDTVRVSSTISAQHGAKGSPLDQQAPLARDMSAMLASGPPDKKVPEGYAHFPGIGYYKFHPNGLTWPSARLACENEGAHLAIINSEREADVMSQLFARYPKPLIQAGGNDDWAWLGAHEMGVDGEYFTIFGEPLTSTGFTRWVKGEPNDKAVDTAVVTHRASGGLGDAYPAWNASYVCEL